MSETHETERKSKKILKRVPCFPEVNIVLWTGNSYLAVRDAHISSTSAHQIPDDQGGIFRKEKADLLSKSHVGHPDYFNKVP